MNEQVKRLISGLNNLTLNQNNIESVLVHKNYAVIDDGNNKIVYQKIKKEKKEIWVESKVDYSVVLKQAGYKLLTQKARNNVNYVSVMRKEYVKLKEHEKINYDKKDFSNLELKDKKEMLIKYYNDCFGNGVKGHDNKKYFYLAILKEELEEDIKKERKDKQNSGYVAKNVIDTHELIYKNRYSGQYFSSNVTKNKKYEIKRNLNGVRRFLEYSNSLRDGVFTLSSIPITYFVKIKVDDWRNFTSKKGQFDDKEDDELEEIENGK